ncbi:sulfotransferase family protein [Pseudoalteromonas sp. A601]|uniref:sulfotransferase n=1 Tax=Pseudoalteromonas sp. A601 TaxID=1967839 RepID=UPI000B3CB732|nr:sulfotransferase [Pseudoalteromonas sp. A601]OUS72651.1 sulfotransferase family protein [Pseudoalteromonas sp. A601]
MQHRYHFIAGLPRAGSTLLASILRQNPDFHADMSTPVAGFVTNLLEQMGSGSEFASSITSVQRLNICRAICSGYYQEVEKPVVFDTNRLWTAKLNVLNTLFGNDFKVICLVRNPAWVMDSFERIYRKNSLEFSRIYSAATRQNVYTRCEHIASNLGPFGSAWAALKEGFYGEFSEQLLLLDYDLLVTKPENSLALIYQFLGLPGYQHDFENVSYNASEFDKNLGAEGLHAVKQKVEFTGRKTVLPPELFKKYSDMAFWLDPQGSNASLITQKTP